MNEQEQVGVLLTSRDTGDIEALLQARHHHQPRPDCLWDKVSALKRSYLTSKQVDVRYAEQLPADFQVASRNPQSHRLRRQTRRRAPRPSNPSSPA
ncbi:MAG: hypothetical protein R2911_39750 [Caldilineaceae bacterium]